MKILMGICLMIGAAACTSVPDKNWNESQIKIRVLLEHEEYRSSDEGGHKVRTRLSLEPNKKVLVAGFSQANKENAPQDYRYSLIAEPVGEDVLFSLIQNQKMVARIQVLNTPGERSSIGGASSRTRLTILNP